MDVPEVSRTYRVSSNGFLTLPLLTEPVPAAGETLDQLSKLIVTRVHDAGNAEQCAGFRFPQGNQAEHSAGFRRNKSPQADPIYGPTRLLGCSG